MFGVTAGVALLCAEAIAQAWVYEISNQGKLFQPDEVLGWKPIPDLKITRRNANGQLYEIVTNSAGFRGRLDWVTTAERKVLVLGDSFAFGKGVTLENRFDSILDRRLDHFSVVNCGVPGFGTGQAILAGQHHMRELSVGDDLILLTYSNDFYDLARQTFAGRARPTFRRSNGTLIVGPAAITWGEHLRDRSYILSVLFRAFEKHRRFSLPDLRNSGELYVSLVDSYLVPLARRGVNVHVVHHGITKQQKSEYRAAIVGAIERVCSKPEVGCLALDNHLDKDSYFLEDGHWSS